jgi:hypothetical protein
MLPLASDAWGGLRHAFGTAEDVPRLIEHLPMVSEAQRRELWFGLWHLLWREGSAYPASVAAVPHLVSFAATVGAAERAVALHLAGAIVTAPVEGEVAPSLVQALREATVRIPSLVCGCLDEPWAPDTTQVMCAVLAIAKGHAALGGAVLALEAATECRVCGSTHPTAGWRTG